MRSRSAIIPALLCLLLLGAGAVAVGGADRTPADQTPTNQTSPKPTPLGVFIPAMPPRPAPAISFADLAGNGVRLADFRGRVVLVNLWATWCAPCRREMPSLDRLQSRFGDRLAIIAISEDRGGGKAVAPFLLEFGLKSVKVYLDPESAAGFAFKVAGLPSSFLIDRDGNIVGRVEGGADWMSPGIIDSIEPFLDNTIVKTSAPGHR
jgi:thiol-disulfide isomerase/thioredoxin